MDIIISHKSALEYWRSYGYKEKPASAAQYRKGAPGSPPGRIRIRDGVPSGLSRPVNILVSSKTAKRKTKTFKSRVHTGSTPDGCFVSIGDEVAVSSPEFCFFQMAGELPLVKLIELGLELCGTYSLPAINTYRPGVETKDEAKYNRPQLTNIKALKSFTARMKGVNGYKKACRALRYIADGSASPVESILFMFLTLPHSLGGYALPLPVLNRRINMSGAADSKSLKSSYVCDLLWAKAGIAIEYDSDNYHAGKDRIANDAIKRLDLASVGILEITVTSRQLNSPLELEILAKLISRKVGKQLRYKPQKFNKASHDLRCDLLWPIKGAENFFP